MEDRYYKRYLRARSFAQYILEGHTIKETAHEFEVCRDTVKRDLLYLRSYGYDENLVRNKILYDIVMRKVRKNAKKR